MLPITSVLSCTDPIDELDISSYHQNPYDTSGMVGTIPDAVLQVLTRTDCDHVFVIGRKRSPTGKVPFGDAQRMILNLDGPVTVTTASE